MAKAAPAPPWAVLVASLFVLGHIMVQTHSLPVKDELLKESAEDVGLEDVVDSSPKRLKRQVDYYNNYYYDTNVSNNNCGFRRFLTSLGLGINNYYTPYGAYGSSSSRGSGRYSSRRLLRNRQPFLYNGRRGLYPPYRYFSSTTTSTYP